MSSAQYLYPICMVDPVPAYLSHSWTEYALTLYWIHASHDQAFHMLDGATIFLGTFNFSLREERHVSPPET
jgi:hypothetical protein